MTELEPAASISPSGVGLASPVTDTPSPAIAQQPVHAVWTQPSSHKAVSVSFVLGVIAIAVLSLVFLLVLGYVMLTLGPIASVICGILALIPLAVVLLVISWIDRWEPEPRGALWFAFLWGAAASVALALLVDVGVQIVVYAASNGQSVSSDLFGAVIQAPIVEETAKGVGILILFLVLRKNFDGPIDGLVYGATVAAGFAFTENILYFGSALIEDGGESLGFTFMIRGIMSPFAHVMFTACTGVALGFASRKRGWLPAIGFLTLGLSCAMILHAVWNGTTFVAEGFEGFLLIYCVVQIPLFVLAIIGVVFLRKAEARVTKARLAEYAAAGWFTADEVDMLSTGAGRSRARAWARSQPGKKRPLMKRFIKDATALAFTRQRLLTRRDHIGTQRQERDLLDAIVADRTVLLEPVAAPLASATGVAPDIRS